MNAAKKVAPKETSNAYEDLPLSENIFNKITKHMYRLAGVDLPFTPKNQALIRNRIVKVLRSRSLTSYEEYWKLLEKGDAEITAEFISALTTNMTSFYRESAHFDFLAQILPDMLKNTKAGVRIWCAAASTGQEPYTIAMTAFESEEREVSKIKILATDIDLQVLKKAAHGCYEEKEMQGLPPIHIQKYFDPVQTEGEKTWRIKDKVHSLIRFAPYNLNNSAYDFQYKFQVIFCRNVLIYFDEATTKKVIDNLVTCLAPNGYLILGHSESGNVKHPDLISLSRAVYQKK